MTWAGVFMLLTVFSCGRKTLPLPPDVYMPPAVKDFRVMFETGDVCLSWIVPDGAAQQKQGLSEMVIFQADQSASCPHCPLSFEPVATVPAGAMVENDQGDLQGSYTLAVDGNGPFSFYVVASSQTGVAGPKSDIVKSSCPAEAH